MRLALVLPLVIVAACDGRPPTASDATIADASRSAGIDDLDNDGVADCWSSRYEGGSGFGGVQLIVQLDCTGEPLVVDASGSFGEFLVAPTLPAGLDHPGAVAGVIDRLYGAAHRVCADATCEDRDGSFAWLLDERAARDLSPLPLGPFAHVWRYTPRWASGAPAPPPSQVMLIPGDPPSLIAYHAHNHAALTRAGRCGDVVLWTTAHGVAVEDLPSHRWSWVYISNGVHKLRWPSITRVACAAGLVAIERVVDGNHELVMVDPASGGLGRLPLETPWTVAGDHLYLGAAALPLAQLTSQLAPSAWQSHLDLDGDGAVDRIEVGFTGGAHCCYTLELVLASGVRHRLPFEMDGGYVGGLDLSRPSHFAVGDHDGDGLPDLQAVAGTYSMHVYPPSPALRRHGVRGNRILIDVGTGRLRIRDWPP